MLYVFKSGTHRNTASDLSEATAELNEAVDAYLSDKPGMLVAGMGELYFHTDSDTFTIFLPVMFAQAAEEEDL